MKFRVAVIALLFLTLSTHQSKAFFVPTWFDQNASDFSVNLVLGQRDIDVLILSGLTPNREWFAWVETDRQNTIALSSWTGFAAANVIGPQIDIDFTSSPISTNAPALNGFVLGDGSINLCVSSVVDTNCIRANSSHPIPDAPLSLYVQLAPDIPEPGSIGLFLLGMLTIGLVYFRRNHGPGSSIA